MLPLWLLLPLVDGVSQNVSDYCKEMHARRPQRANVILALRGEAFRNGAGQATIHTCCPSSYARQREVFASHKAFIEQLAARVHFLAVVRDVLADAIDEGQQQPQGQHH